MNDEIKRQKEIIARKETDWKRWFDERSYDSAWQPRAVAAFKLAAEGQWFCDVGCGKQALRSIIPPEAIYLPCDLRQWTPDTLPCDINGGILPLEYLRLSDTCFLLGVLEYIYDVPAFLSALAKEVDQVVLSYCPRELTGEPKGSGWVNAFTTQELLELATRAGLVAQCCVQFERKQILARFVSKYPQLDRKMLLQSRRARFLHTHSSGFSALALDIKPSPID